MFLFAFSTVIMGTEITKAFEIHPKTDSSFLKKSIQILWWLMTWPFKEPQHEQSLYKFGLSIIFLSLTWEVKAKCNWPQTICWHLKECHSIIKQVALLMARIIAKLSTSRYTGGLNNACYHCSYRLCHGICTPFHRALLHCDDIISSLWCVWSIYIFPRVV